MAVTLYLDPLSQPCRAIDIFVKMNGIPYEEKAMQLLKGDSRSEWFGKITPLRAVPVLQDGDFTLTESVAIFKYLINKNKVASNWYPSDIRQRARVDEFLMWLNCMGGLRQKAVTVFIEKAIKPFRSGQPADEEKLKGGVEALGPVLDTLENVFLSRGDYIDGGNDVTLADLTAVCELMQLISAGFNVAEGRPKLAAWLERVKARLQPCFDEVHKFILEFGGKYK